MAEKWNFQPMLKLPHVGAVKLGKMLTGAVKLEHE